ncbi:MAG: S1 RNA-binding domain-containing protein, partial [Nioella sp.]
MAQNASMEDFEALLEESFEMDTPEEGTVVKGKVIAVEAGQAIIDVGYKMEGRVDLKEFANPGEQPDISVGDEVEVFLRSAENAKGEAVISREMARREEAWDRLEKAYADEERVEGAIFGRVKGGFTVDLGGAVAFLPGSQVDVRPVRDAGPLMGLKQPFQILKMDRRRGNIVVSRRAILEESRAEQRAEVRFDCSRLDQWEIVFTHAQKNGIFLHFKTLEHENQGLLDNGAIGANTKLYYRELIARFGHHLALNWNLCEEIGDWANHGTPSMPLDINQRRALSEYIYETDAYHHHMVIH